MDVFEFRSKCSRLLIDTKSFHDYFSVIIFVVCLKIGNCHMDMSATVAKFIEG